MTDRIVPGSPVPLGATTTPEGTNFAVVSSGDSVDLCLFDADGHETRLTLPERTGAVRHGFVPGITAGQRYGYRVSGPYEPRSGLRFNPAKLLLDPYSRAIEGQVTFGPEVLGHTVGEPYTASPLDSAPHMPRSLVLDPLAADRSSSRPNRPLADTVLYEMHVKGFTARHPDVPPALRGTYAGLGHPAALGHLTRLGVTAVELLPVHHCVPESFLVEEGLTNYWGYNTIGFFAPNARYSAAVRGGNPGGEVAEFRAMVDAAHDAGIEVILDVVYNHTAEAGADGPTLCYRGLANAEYYSLDAADPENYVDTTGCGNSLNAGHPVPLQLIMDSLRYWVSDMGVDGFRFDLAPTLARERGVFDPSASFFDLISQDPVISRVKLIAEPWDVGRADSYDIGRFPSVWSEWNGRFRDTVRDFWRGQDGMLGDFASRLAGSSDFFRGPQGRRPSASVNLITVHDGFTLTDLVSYNDKHNEANLEGNRDGNSDNRSWNCGQEGVTDDPAIAALRVHQRRALLSTLLVSAGVPLLLGGDELGRSQGGNNNAYCQDNEISWFDWANRDEELSAFTRDLIRLRREHPVFRRRHYLTGAEAGHLRWYTPSGAEMTDQDWADSNARCVTVLFDGDENPDLAPDGTLLIDDDFLVLFNGWREPLPFHLPAEMAERGWTIVSDSADPSRSDADPTDLTVAARSVLILRAAEPV